MTLQRILTTLLLVAVLTSCAPAPAAEVVPTTTSTSTPNPTDTPTSTPTIVPTATPYGGGANLPRVAIFTELEPDDSVAGYIRIADVDNNTGKLLFNNTKIRVGTKPGSLSSTGYHERYPPLIRWSSNGNYLAYTWFEDDKAIIYVYDYAAQKLKWEIELRSNHPSRLHFTINWSADSNWAYIGVDNYSHYILNVSNGEVNKPSINKEIQGVEWDASQPILYFGEMWTSSFYQYDPANNEILQIEPKEFDPTQFEEIGSYNTYGQYSRDNNGYIFEATNKDNSVSYYLESSNDPIFELLQIGGNVTRNELHVYEIIPSPDKSFYLISAGTNLSFNDEYDTYYTSLALSADRPMTVTSMDSVNGIYPLSWSPDGTSYIGYQFANKKGGYYIPLIKMVIVDAATNTIVKEYELNYDQVNSIYGYSLETHLMDSTGPLGIDVYWK